MHKYLNKHCILKLGVSLQSCTGLTSSQSKHALQSVLPSSGLVHPCTMFWLGFNIALRLHVSHIQRTQMICNNANAMQLKEKHDWAIIYRVNTTNKLKRQKGWCCNKRIQVQVFQLEVFPTKKHYQLAQKKLSKDIKQERTIRIIYLTSKQLQQAQQKQPTTDHNRVEMIYN